MLATLSGGTALYPIVGDPILYVKTPQRLTAKFAERGHEGICVPMQVPDGALAAVLAGLTATPNVRGILVTMPHKNAIFASCASASDRATSLQVASVMRRNKDGGWHAEMLDGLAFVDALKKNGISARGARVLQVGAGGVGSAIATALLEAGVATLGLYDTDSARSAALVAQLKGPDRDIHQSERPHPNGYDLVVNATPLGMHPDDPSPVPIDQLTAEMSVGDVIAGHGVTRLLDAAGRMGCRTANGVDMVEAVIELMADFFLNPG